MVQPPPPGAPPGPADPYAADRILAQWAQARGYVLSATPDLRWYQGWFPCVYLPPIARVGREVKATFGEANVAIVEAFEGDVLKQATGEDRSVVAFLMSSKLTHRAAIRSKAGGGLVNEISSGLGSLFKSGGTPGTVLGDPTFEARFDVTTPSREESAFALKMPLRQWLLQTSWRGILEIRGGGAICTPFERRFEPATLDALVTAVGQIYSLAIG